MKKLEFKKSVEVVNSAVMQMVANAQVRHQVNSMVIYRDDLYHDTEDTDIHRMLKGPSLGKGKQKVTSAQMMCSVVARCATAYMLGQMFTPAEQRLLGDNAFSFDGDAIDAAASMASGIRLLKTKDRVKVSIPVNVSTIDFDRVNSLLEVAGDNMHSREGLLKTVRRVSNVFGPEFFELDVGLEKTFASDDVLKLETPNFKWDRENSVLTEEYFQILRSGVKAVRVTIPQLPSAEWPSITLGDDTRPTRVGNPDALTIDADKIRYFKEVLRKRLSMITIFAVVELDKAFAQAVAQQDFDKMQLQYLNAWVQGTVESEVGKRRGTVADFMTPLTSIRKFNTTSRYTGKKKTNENNLLVTRKGSLMYIPEVDNIDYVESQIENECKVAGSGEWTLNDVINPESSNYEMRVSEHDGVARRMRKNKGANRAVYTDWKNAKFSYTDTSGALRVMDLGSCRPVDASHIKELLDTQITSASSENAASSIVVSLLNAAEKAHLVVLPTDEEVNSMFSSTGTQSVSEYQGYVRSGSWNAALAMVINQMDPVKNGSIILGDAKVTPELKSYCEENEFFKLGEIGPECPLPPLRFIWRTAENLLKVATRDIDKFTSGRSVMAGLYDLATASILHSYGGKLKHIEEQDKELRHKYLEPDLLPVKEVTLDNIPFLKDLTVMPHQMKAWNYLKNMPENLVLDVAAGGGKTILALIDIARFLGAGGKKPLVAMPNNLIKNYIDDANLVFKGRMNMVVINGETMASWGAERLMKLIDASPVNTIFLTSYDFFKANKDFASYGTVGQEVSLNADFMRQFEWGGVWMDESHRLKNEDSNVTRAMLQVVADIPYKRQLTGTYIPDTYTDVVAQMAAMNPTVFNTKEEFEARYKDENQGRGAWIPNAGRKIRQRMSEFANVVTIKRREWRSLLPPQEEEFHPVNLSPAQDAVYQDIVREESLRMQEMISRDPKLQEMIQNQQGNEEIQAALAEALDVVFQRLEQFLSSPAADASGKTLLIEPEDQVSPKLKKAYEIMQKHLDDGIPGKVLIFTQYTETARALFHHAPPALKAKIVHYTATNKVRCMQEFKNSPDKMFMVGVETSMNTGLNLQFCSRLIRMETVWNWGNLEQGESRVMRPNIKSVEFRDAIYFDWIFANRTVDVTKTGRMISKLVSTAKFYEPEDPNFQNLPDVEMVSLGLESIAARNDWEDDEVGLKKHFDAYQAYRSAEYKSFEDFKKNPLNRTESGYIEDGGIMPGSGMITQVPYIADMELYGMEELGLLKYSEYVNANAPAGTFNAIDTFDPTNLKIHTELGDGVCTGPGLRTIKSKDGNGKTVSTQVQTGSIWVEINGKKVSFSKTNVFVITKNHTNSRSIREAMARLAGANAGAPVVVQDVVPKVKKSKETVVPTVEPENMPSISLQLIGYNEYLCLGINTENSDISESELSRLKFNKIRPYMYAHVRKWQHLEAWIEKVESKFYIDPSLLSGLKHVEEMWQKSRNNLHLMQQLNAAKIRNFLLKKNRPVEKGEIKPYIMVMDEEVYVCLDKAANSSMLSKVRSINVPGVRWDDFEDSEWFHFASSKSDVRSIVDNLKTQYNITNIDKFTKYFNEVKVINRPTKT